MGILAVLLLVNGACVVVGTLALPQAATRFMAENLAKIKPDKASGVFFQAIRSTLVFSLPLALSTFFAATTLATSLVGQQGVAVLFKFLSLDIILYTGLLPVLIASMLGLQKFRDAAFLGIVNILVRQSLIVFAVIILQSFLGLVIAWVIADAIAAAIYLTYMIRLLGPPHFGFPLKSMLKFSLPLWVSNNVGFAAQWFDRVILLLLVPLATLGVYSVTVTAFSVLIGVASAMSDTLFAAYSALQSRQQVGDLNPAMKTATRYVSLVAIPLALGLFATAGPALTFFVGQAYVSGAIPLMILSMAFAVTIVGTALSPMLLALGETAASSLISIGSVALSLTVAFALVPLFGMVGAAVARGLSLIATTGLTILFLRRKLSLHLDLEAFSKSIIAGGTMAVVVMALQIWFHSRFLLLGCVLVGGVTYLVMLRLLKAAQPRDVDLINKYFGKRLAFIGSLLKTILLPRQRTAA